MIWSFLGYYRKSSQVYRGYLSLLKITKYGYVDELLAYFSKVCTTFGTSRGQCHYAILNVSYFEFEAASLVSETSVIDFIRRVKEPFSYY